MEKSNPLDRWLKLKKENKVSQTIKSRPKEEPAVLSYGQERLWFLNRLFPDSSAYHFSDSFRLRGKLDTDRLKHSILEVIRRHEVLRTTYSFEGNHIVQQILPDPLLDFRKVDLAPGQTWDDVHSQATLLAREPFDLQTGPLIRLAVFQLKKDDYFLLITFHHIVIDAWSLPIFWKEVKALYCGDTLSELPLQFADFAKWQKEQPLNEKPLAYWKTQLESIQPVNLPSDFARPAVPAFEGKLASRKISLALSKKLQQLAQDSETTLFVLLTAAFKLFLSKYSGENDIAIGTPFAKRDRAELDHMIGFFVNTLILRSDLSGNPRFLDFLKTVKTTTLDAFANSNIPFEKLVDVLKPNRSLNQNPLFNTMLIFRQVDKHALDLPGMDLEPILLDTGVSKFDLSLFVDEQGQELTTTIEYNTKILSAATIERMSGHFETLLENIVERPEAPVGSLSLMPLPEREKILVKWNETSVGRPNADCIHHWIEEQARIAPENIAVVAGKNSITYHDLNEKAAVLAACLLKEGVGPGVPVGLCTDRSIDMIVSLLAILKAGGAYVPIDPAYPQDRKVFMMEDAQVPILITQLHLAGALPHTKAKVIFADGRIPSEAGETSFPTITSDDPAYIIYTSGSSGRPKGVPVSHRNLVYSTFARFEYYKNNPHAFLLLSSFGFDSSVVGIFWTLCAGGKLVLPEHRSEQDMHGLSMLIADQKVTHTLLLPSLYELLLNQAPPMNLATLSTVIVAGEACPSSTVKLHHLILSKADLFNEYGPTEATVWSTVHKTGLPDINRPVPIGRPIPHAQNYILDKNMAPVPIGVPGELYIGGVGVAGRYLNRPELTKSVFVDNPFSNVPGALLYKTGDLAFYYPDGLIGFIGRADQQVKVRGFRIELEEIKEIIKENPAVLDAAVIVKGAQSSSILSGSDPEDTEQLEAALNKLGTNEANRLLQFIETLSENELEYMLTRIGSSEKTPSA